MALHTSFYTMAIEAIDEYLQASADCLNFAKRDDGVLGYPATLLLFCVANALGVYLSGESVTIAGRPQKITDGEPFRVLNHECFGLGLDHEQIKRLERVYRNALAHNAIIDLGAILVAHVDGPVFRFRPNGNVRINLQSFHKLVAEAWRQFPKERIKSWAERHHKFRLEHPI
jgi:hypothetical protein